MIKLCLEIWGDYALFSRPEMKVERVSYDVITPSAARGIMEAIYWHPGIRYEVSRIFVLNKIKFANIRRNEVSQKISASNVKKFMKSKEGELYIATSKDRTQRFSMVLKDVHYVIEIQVETTKENLLKTYNILQRRLIKGQCYHTPYFGTREFPARFKLCEDISKIETAYPNEVRDLGFMLYDMDYSDKNNICPRFFRAKMENGIINVKRSEVFR
ncbi:MAG: type I-C CRISPR-associated protein Cas5 [Quinella sp. 3Q1]|nr:type I-C CRISPR-associated protein Cas5 [Quinella sp. 3Q1]